MKARTYADQQSAKTADQQIHQVDKHITINRSSRPTSTCHKTPAGLTVHCQRRLPPAQPAAAQHSSPGSTHSTRHRQKQQMQQQWQRQGYRQIATKMAQHNTAATACFDSLPFLVPG
jgi:hypothetical protein